MSLKNRIKTALEISTPGGLSAYAGRKIGSSLGSNVKEEYNKLEDKLTDRVEALGSSYEDDSVGLGRKALRTAGAAGGAVGDVLEAFTPQPILDATEFVMDKSGASEGLMNLLGKIPEEYQPDAMAALEAMNLAGVASVATSPVRHQILGSMKNYIPFHYSPEIQTNPIKGWEMKPPLKQVGVPLQRKIRGGAQWSGENLLHLAENLFDPRARALLDETGVSAHVKRQMNRGSTTPKDVGVDNAQIKYQQYIDKHSGRNKGLAPVAEELANRQMFEEIRPWKPGEFKRGMKEWDSPESGLSDADYQRFSDFVEKGQRIAGQKGTPQMTMKAPRGAGGNHYNDVLYDSPPIKSFKAAFKKMNKEGGEIDVARLRKEIEAEQKLNRKRLKKSNLSEKERNKKDWFIQEGPDGAVWVSGGRVGKRGITEGGIQYMIRLEPNGNMQGIMVDTHDFMEGVPGVKHIVKDPVVAATPPMHSSVYSLMPTLKSKGQKVPTAVERPKGGKDKEGNWLFTKEVQNKKGETKTQPVYSPTDAALREAIGQLKPSREAVLRETGKVAAGTPLLFDTLTEDEK